MHPVDIQLKLQEAAKSLRQAQYIAALYDEPLPDLRPITQDLLQIAALGPGRFDRFNRQPSLTARNAG